MKKGCFFLRYIAIVIVSILVLFVAFVQYRKFFTIGDITFTFWKTLGGYCYIMPYKYWGITIPKNNYMRASNLGGIIIFIGEDTTLYIFPHHTYYLGAKTIECNLPSYKHVYFPYINELDNISAFNDKIKYYKNLGYPYLQVYIAGMYREDCVIP